MPAVSCIFMFLQQIKKLKKVNCILFLGGLFLPQFFNFFGFASAFDFFNLNIYNLTKEADKVFGKI